MKTISVIVETYNANADSEIELRHVLDSLSKQTYPQEKIEIIVVVDETNTQLADFLKAEYPAVQVELIEKSTYYAMKFLGVQSARGEIVALLDSDCLPSKHWAESIVSSISKGADVVAGKTRYPIDERFSRTFNLFNFGYIQNDENGDANGFIVNNAAFRRDVILKHTFDDRLCRSGGGYLLASQLKALKYKLVYNPGQLAIHNNYGLRYDILMRARAGYEAVNLCQLDEAGVLSERKYLKFGVLSPFIFSVRRLLYDFKCIVSNRRDLNISLHTIPYFFAVSAIIRGLEVIPGIIAVIKPGYFGKKFGW